MHGYAETREILKTSGAEPVFPDQLAILKTRVPRTAFEGGFFTGTTSLITWQMERMRRPFPPLYKKTNIDETVCFGVLHLWVPLGAKYKKLTRGRRLRSIKLSGFQFRVIPENWNG